jgi:hypothetical protein
MTMIDIGTVRALACQSGSASPAATVASATSVNRVRAMN